MQTFLPYRDFSTSLQCLDDKRLGKQRVEAWQLYNGQWPNHPASRMWRNYRNALALYYNFSLVEWKQRGFNNVKLQPIALELRYLDIEMPWWLGHEPFHESHRSNLLRKNFQHYAAQFPDADSVPRNLEYLWPTEVVGQFIC